MSGPPDTGAPGGPERPRRRLGRPSTRRIVQAVVALGLAGLLLGWALPHVTQTSWRKVLEVLAGVGTGTALGLLALMLTGLWAYTFTLTGSLPGLSHPKALVVNVAGSAAGNLLPGGGAAGVAATYLMCRSWGFSRRDISTSVIVSGVWNVLARVALPVVGVLALLSDPATLPAAVVRGGLVGALVGLALLGVFVAVIVSEPAATVIGRALSRLLAPLTRRLRKGREVNVDELILDLRERISTVVRTGWLSMTAGLVGFFGIYYALFWLCLGAVGVHLSWSHLFAAYALGRLLTTVGLTPGGLGFTETGTALVLTGFGANPTDAFAGVVLFSIYSHLAELPLGALGWLAWGATRGRRGADASAAPAVAGHRSSRRT